MYSVVSGNGISSGATTKLERSSFPSTFAPRRFPLPMDLASIVIFIPPPAPVNACNLTFRATTRASEEIDDAIADAIEDTIFDIIVPCAPRGQSVSTQSGTIAKQRSHRPDNRTANKNGHRSFTTDGSSQTHASITDRYASVSGSPEFVKLPRIFMNVNSTYPRSTVWAIPESSPIADT